MKVLIAGAGPTGLTAGVELARRGIHAEIIDKKDEASKLSRAIGINPRSLELLAPSGVTEKLLAHGMRYNAVHFHRGTKPWVMLPLTTATVRHGHNFLVGLPQDQTETILRETFVELGGTIRYGMELTGLRQDDSHVIAETANGAELVCDYLIGADGMRSATRELVGIEYHGHKLPDVWSIADVDIEQFGRSDTITSCLMPNGKMAAIFPLGETRVRLVSNTEDAIEAMPLEVKVTHVRREGQFRVSLNLVKEYSKGRVYLAGDAAHSQSPAGGRGMNLGIADAADLATRLAGCDLSGYTRDRYEEGKRVIAGAEQMRKLVTSTNPGARFLLLAMLKTVAALPPLERKLASAFLYG